MFVIRELNAYTGKLHWSRNKEKSTTLSVLLSEPMSLPSERHLISFSICLLVRTRVKGNLYFCLAHKTIGRIHLGNMKQFMCLKRIMLFIDSITFPKASSWCCITWSHLSPIRLQAITVVCCSQWILNCTCRAWRVKSEKWFLNSEKRHKVVEATL